VGLGRREVAAQSVCCPSGHSEQGLLFVANHNTCWGLSSIPKAVAHSECSRRLTRSDGQSAGMEWQAHSRGCKQQLPPRTMRRMRWQQKPKPPTAGWGRLACKPIVMFTCPRLEDDGSSRCVASSAGHPACRTLSFTVTYRPAAAALPLLLSACSWVRTR
jgi:hypothetical protein